MLRRYIRQILEWCHATLVLALIIPMVYALVLNSDNRASYSGFVDSLYWKCLIVAIPVVLSGIAVKRCKTLTGYILISGIVLFVTGGLAWLLGPLLTGSTFLQGYVVFIIIEGFAVIVARYVERLNTLKMRQDGDLDWVPRTGFLDKPRMPLMCAFVFAYLVGIFLYFPILTDGAFYSACVYFVVCMLHMFIMSTDRYFLLNKRVSGLPKKRLYGITSSVLAIFMLAIGAVIIVAVLLSDARQYTDIRDWRSDRPLIMVDYESEANLQIGDNGINYMEMLAGGQEIKTLPKWISDLFMAVLGIILLVVVFQVLKSIKKVFNNFRDAMDENGDEIEDLTDLEDAVVSLKPKKEDKNITGYSIRKQYKQMIRKHRKERPMPYETPTEIEKNAGLLEDEKMQELHVLYEEVRYGGQRQIK